MRKLLKFVKDKTSHLSRKQKFALSGVSVVILSLTLIGVWTVFIRPAPATAPDPIARLIEVCVLETSEVEDIDNTTFDERQHSKDITDCDEPIFRSELTGLEISEARSKLPVTSVQIENSPNSRPQSGLSEAGLVFEAISEGGITRFAALYQEDKPENLGPIRSMRPYYLDLIVPFDAAFAHVGGSGTAKRQITSQSLRSMDQRFNGSFYTRVSYRYAPHNVYTSRNRLLELQRNKGWGKSTFTGFPRHEEAGEAIEEPTASTISFDISSSLYNSRFEYNKKTNKYKRFQAGQPHNDAGNNEQITSDVVVALIMPRRADGIYSVYNTTAGGKMLVFQNGEVVEGVWSKSDRVSQFEFKTMDDEILYLSPGRTWVTLVANNSMVSYN